MNLWLMHYYWNTHNCETLTVVSFDSLRSKRFLRVLRPFEAFFAFCRRKSWGELNTDGSSGEGVGRREKETLTRKPHDFEKRPFDTFAVG